MDELTRSARLDAIAATRAMLDNDEDAVAHLVTRTPESRAMAHAAVGLAASLLAAYPVDARERILSGLMRAAVEE